MPGKAGEPAYHAGWIVLEDDRRLTLPADAASKLTWYKPGEQVAVLVELRRPRSLILHPGDRSKEVEIQRNQLAGEFESRIEGARRVALSHLRFQDAFIREKYRRITLSTSMANHIGVDVGSRMLMLLYENVIELLNESDGLALLAHSGGDVVLE